MRRTSVMTEILAGAPISAGILNQFVNAFYRMRPKAVLLNPDEDMKYHLMRAKHIGGNFHLSHRYIFEIEDGNIKNVYIAPSFSGHTKKRFGERFGIRGTKRFFLAAVEVNSGRVLSHQEKRQRRIGGKVMAVQFEDRIYLLDEIRYRIITIMEVL